MNSMYDVAIIGLGPAGSTLARLLSKEFKIIAIDKKYTINNGFQNALWWITFLPCSRSLCKILI